MARSWQLKSKAPHDFYLGLDISTYWDHEHNVETIYEEGFVRPLTLSDIQCVCTIFFNGDVEDPIFFIECNEDLNEQQLAEANQQLARILGTHLETRPLYDMAAKDPLIGPLLNDYYGLKRISRGTLFEETLNRIVQMNLSHKPTARKMMYKVREKYGTTLSYKNGVLACWPTAEAFVNANPQDIRACGPTVRKGEYIILLAEKIVSGTLDMDRLDYKATNEDFMNTLMAQKGIGPSAAQQLLLTRDATDGIFPSTKQKGEEKGLRRWILYSYGLSPDNSTEEEFQEVIKNWKGYEAVALEFLYLNWIMTEKARKKAKKSKK